MESLFFRILDDSCPSQSGSFWSCLEEFVKYYELFCSDGYLYLVIHPDFKDSLYHFFEKYNVVFELYSLVKL